jgi:transposase
MTSKTTNRFSPEGRIRAVRMVQDHEGEHASRWAAVVSISAKRGFTPQTLHEWVKKAEFDSGRRSGVPSDVSNRLKALEHENRKLRQAKTTSCARRRLILPRRSPTAGTSHDCVHRRSPRGPWDRADLQGLADRPLDLSCRCRQARQSGEALRASEAGYGAEAGDRPRLRGELRGLWRAQGLAAIAAREL